MTKIKIRQDQYSLYVTKKRGYRTNYYRPVMSTESYPKELLDGSYIRDTNSVFSKNDVVEVDPESRDLCNHIVLTVNNIKEYWHWHGGSVLYTSSLDAWHPEK